MTVRGLLAGCAVLCAVAAENPVRADVSSNPAPLTETRVFAGDSNVCTTAPPVAATENAIALAIPFATAAAGKIVEAGAQEFSDYLTRTIANDSTAVTVNVESTYFYQLRKNIKHQWAVTPALECIAIVRGRFGTLDSRTLASSASKLDPRHRFSRVDEHRLLQFPILKDLGLADFPDLYLELALERDPFDSVFRLQPRVIYYRQSGVKVPADKRIDLNVVATFARPDGTSLGVLPLRLSGLQIGVDYPPEAISASNPWSPMPQRPDPAVLSKSPLGRQAAQLTVTPVNLTVTVEETGAPQRFLAFLSHVLAGSKADLGKAAEDATRQILNAQSKTRAQ